MIRMLITSASSVVSKATASPVVTLPIESFITSRSTAPPTDSENPPTAAPMPMTVPMKPRMGTAQMKTRSIV
jgi:hypothetical protein